MVTIGIFPEEDVTKKRNPRRGGPQEAQSLQPAQWAGVQDELRVGA